MTSGSIKITPSEVAQTGDYMTTFGSNTETYGNHASASMQRVNEHVSKAKSPIASGLSKLASGVDKAFCGIFSQIGRVGKKAGSNLTTGAKNTSHGENDVENSFKKIGKQKDDGRDRPKTTTTSGPSGAGSSKPAPAGHHGTDKPASETPTGPKGTTDPSSASTPNKHGKDAPTGETPKGPNGQGTTEPSSASGKPGKDAPASETPTGDTGKPTPDPSSAPGKHGKDTPTGENPTGGGHTEESSASTPNPATQAKINDHQSKADTHKEDSEADWWTKEEKDRYGKASGYHQNAADGYKAGDTNKGDNNATAAKHQEQAIGLHDEALGNAGTQKQHQTAAANHYEQAADHASKGQHDAANAHVNQAQQHLAQNKTDEFNRKGNYKPADLHQVAGRHQGLAADQHSEAAKLGDNHPAAADHRNAAQQHQQAADHWANGKQSDAHASAAKANQHAADGYSKQGDQAMANHHQGLANNHQSASDHLSQAEDHRKQSQAAEGKDEAARQQHEQEMWKRQQLAAHQNGIAHNTHQQLVHQNAGNTEQANHHAQAVTHHQQQQQQVHNYQQPAPPTHKPADPHNPDKVEYQPSANQPNVYRWDDRPTSQVFTNGMEPQHPTSEHSLLTHTQGKPDTHYVSTSANPSFQWNKQNRWVMKPPGGMHDVNATLGTESPYPHQHEATNEGTIPSGNMVAAENPVTGEVEFPKRGGTL